MKKGWYLIGKQYIERRQPRGGTGANQYTAEQNPQKEGTANTAEVIAAENKVGRATVERAAKFAEAVDATPKWRRWLG